jgi:streptogramin lyase
VYASHRTRRRPHAGLRSGVALTALAALITLSSGPLAHANSPRPAVAIKPPAYGTIWVTAQSTESLLEFAPGANKQATPIADVNGVATELNNPTGLAIDRHGRLWVANLSAAMIAVFGEHANGNVKPVMSIVGAKTGLNAPIGIALAQNGDLWVANSGSNTVAEFAAGAHGNVAPIRTIEGSRTLLRGARAKGEGATLPRGVCRDGQRQRQAADPDQRKQDASQRPLRTRSWCQRQ